METIRRSSLTIIAAVITSVIIGALVYLRKHDEYYWLVDVDVYRFGAGSVLHGGDLYQDKTPFTDLYFTYPPIAALLFVPLAFGALATTGFIWVCVEALFLLLTVWLILGVIGAKARATLTVAITLASLLLAPVDFDLSFGQINIMLMFLVLLDLLRGDGRRWQGIGIGIAAGIKLVPLIYIVYLVLTGRIKSAARAAGVFAGTVVIGFMVLPAESADYWFGPGISADRPGIPQGALNQALRAVLARLLHSAEPINIAWLITAIIVGCLGLAAAAALHRAGHPLRGVLVCAMTALLVSPVAWVPHWVWAVPLLIVLGDLAWRGRSVGWAALTIGTGLVFGLRLVIWFVPVTAFNPISGPHNLNLSAGSQLAAASYAIAALVVMTILAYPVLRREQIRADIRT
jgi:alpha-1,2-mannosyltransferase